jgi:phage tail-like protein
MIQRVDTDLMTIGTPPPPVASSRSYLRCGLPSIYREDPRGVSDHPFSMRFVGGLEQVLDPVVAMADLLPAHFDAVTAPPDVIELLAAWLGLDFDRALRHEARRQLVLNGWELIRKRGTRAGVELLLECVFPELALSVSDNGGVSWSAVAADSGSAAPQPALTVSCPPLEPAELKAIRRVVAAFTPVHVTLTVVEREGAAA